MNKKALRKRLELERMMGVDVLPVAAGLETRLEQIEQEVRACTACRLHETRTQGVFARGDPHSELMFVGEAPGADEDEQGVPFVGRAGRLLDRMIFAMGLERDAVYVTNILKSRPPNNRDPRADEVEACFPYLEQQIELIQPRIICTLGLPAARGLVGGNRSMGSMRGKWQSFRGIPLLPTYHPAYLLRQPSQKQKVWWDLKKLVMALKHGPPKVLF